MGFKLNMKFIHISYIPTLKVMLWNVFCVPTFGMWPIISGYLWIFYLKHQVSVQKFEVYNIQDFRLLNGDAQSVLISFNIKLLLLYLSNHYSLFFVFVRKSETCSVSFQFRDFFLHLWPKKPWKVLHLLRIISSWKGLTLQLASIHLQSSGRHSRLLSAFRLAKPQHGSDQTDRNPQGFS